MDIWSGRCPSPKEKEPWSQVKPFSQRHAERGGERAGKEGESHSRLPLMGSLLAQSVKDGRQMTTRGSLLPDWLLYRTGLTAWPVSAAKEAQAAFLGWNDI